MRLVLDANECIFGLGPRRRRECERLLQVAARHDVRIGRTIAREVMDNLPPDAHHRFYAYLGEAVNLVPPIDEDYVIPFELGMGYEAMGLKPADALIAAYVESIEADVLVSENRHFLAKAVGMPFAVHDAKSFLEAFEPPASLT
jgi:hypothetical protein